MTNENEQILINMMYAGAYNFENIGHEIINLYKPDNSSKGESYVYITPSCMIPESQRKVVKTVLLCRPAGKGMAEIIAKANVGKWLIDVPKDADEKFKKSEEELLKEYFQKEIEKKSKSSFDIKGKSLEVIKDEFIALKLKGDGEAKLENKEKIRFYLKEICKDNAIDIEDIDINDENFEDKLELEVYIKKLKKEAKKKELTEKFIYRNTNHLLSRKDIKNLQNRFLMKQLVNKEFSDKFKENNTKAQNNKIEFINNQDNKEDINLNELKELKDKLPCVKTIKLETSNKKITLDELLNTVELLKENKENGLEDFLFKKYKMTTSVNNWLKYRNSHNWQINLINDKEKGIKYGNVELNKIYDGYLGEDLARYFSFKGEVKKPKDPVYIEYESSDTSNSAEKESNAKYKGFDKNSRTFKFKNLKIRNQSLRAYISSQDFKKNIENKENIQWIDIKEIKDTKTKLELCFLDITGKQHEELAYSNMFAHFFNKYPEIFEKFAQEVLGVKDFKIGKIFEIAREENDIDIIIYTENDIFVIENKIKSHINGEKYIESQPNENEEIEKQPDDNSKEQSKNLIVYTNQLIKYYYYAESKKDGKNTHYYIFKPDYNRIGQDLERIEKNEDIEDIINNKYRNINYSEIYKFFNKEENKPNKNEKDEESHNFNQFVKALKRHTYETDNTMELEIEYRFKQVINNNSK